MGRPKGSKNTGITLVIGNCPDCNKVLGSYRSKKCISCTKTGVARPDMIGHTWNVGKGRPGGFHVSSETKKKISEAKKGVPLAPETRAKILATVKRGIDNPRWRGNRTERQTAHNSIEYKQWRSAVFNRDNFTCQVCRQYSGVLHADHIERWADNEDLRYAVENGRTLCVPCHYYITFKLKMAVGTNWCNFTMTKKEG